MKWPWSKKPQPRQQRRLPSILGRLEGVVSELEAFTHIHPYEKFDLIKERDAALARMQDAIDQQMILGDEIYKLKRTPCHACGGEWFPLTKPSPSKSDPDYDAAIAVSIQEDSKKGKP